MQVSYNIPNLLDLAFGVSGLAVYQIPNEDKTGTEVIYTSGDIVNEVDQNPRIGAMGTPIVFPWKLKAGTYNDYDADGNVITTEMVNDFEMPLATLVDVRRSKITKMTKTAASRGAVTEGYGFGNWQLSIKGVLFNDRGHEFPTALEQKEQLLKWENIADSIEVSGTLFTMKDIYRITLKEIKFQQLQGKPELIPFTIKAYSDEPLELILN